VQDHRPKVVVVHDIGTKAEAEATNSIGKRGVPVITTAIGNNLADVL